MDDRKEYAYLLCIGGKIKSVMAKWWHHPEETRTNKAAMHAAAYALKKTAAVLVSEHKDGERWELVDSVQACDVIKPREITITSDNCVLY
ncbi:MAG: hypothetical protein PUE15_10790 [Prevotella sp.]|nr:hypothetical protein [Prevotella sp.]